jgi:hypothetical protein
MSNQEVMDAASGLIGAITDAVIGGKVEWKKVDDHPPGIQEAWTGVIRGPEEIMINVAKGLGDDLGGAAARGGLIVTIPRRVVIGMINAARVESKLTPTEPGLN